MMRAPSSPDHHPFRSKRAVLLAVAAALVAAGCDTPANTADKAAREDIAQSRIALATTADPALGARQAQQLLDAAAGNAVGATTKVQAKALLGQLLLREARDLSWQIDRLDRDVQRLCTEITELSGQVRIGAQLAEGYKQFDPAPTIAALEQRVVEARGGADRAVWFESEGAQFASLSALAQEISRLEGEIAARQEEIRNLESQRVSALASAEDAAKEAEQFSGRSGVAAFTRSSNARRQASDLATQIEGLNAALEPLRTRLQIASAQRDIVSAAAKQLEDQTESLKAGWAQLQKSAQAQSELARRIVSESAPAMTLPTVEGVQVFPAASIAEKAARLDAIIKQSDELRARAASALTDARKHLEDAAQSALSERGAIQTLEGERPGAPEGQGYAWKIARNALSPGLYQLEQAEASRQLAELHSRHAAVLEARLHAAQAAQASLPAAGATVPPELTNGTVEKMQTALKEADAAFKAADELLETVRTGSAQLDADRAAASAARVSRIFGLYRWSILSADLGDNDAARAHMDNARNLVADAIASNVRLPPLPPELQKIVDDAPKPGADAPPTTEPGTQPAEGATEPPPEGAPPAEGTPPPDGTTPPETPPGNPGGGNPG
jgi:hypothetical protein